MLVAETSAALEVSEQQFTELLCQKLGKAWSRALTVFFNCGPHLSFDVTNVLLHAAKQGKVDEVLDILERHYLDHLRFQHPEIRGTVGDRLLRVNPTQAMFLHICWHVLDLQPNPA